MFFRVGMVLQGQQFRYIEKNGKYDFVRSDETRKYSGFYDRVLSQTCVYFQDIVKAGNTGVPSQWNRNGIP